MNSDRIELSAVSYLTEMIIRHELLKPQINSNDKEPSWDGNIYVYKDPAFDNENLEFRLPIQIKGTTQKDYIRVTGEDISYPVKRADLKNYYMDNGVAFFVVVIDPDNNFESKVYIAILTRNELIALLGNDLDTNLASKKSIKLKLIDDVNTLYQTLKEFGNRRVALDATYEKVSIMSKEDFLRSLLVEFATTVGKDFHNKDLELQQIVDTKIKAFDSLYKYVDETW